MQVRPRSAHSNTSLVIDAALVLALSGNPSSTEKALFEFTLLPAKMDHSTPEFPFVSEYLSSHDTRISEVISPQFVIADTANAFAKGQDTWRSAKFRSLYEEGVDPGRSR